MAWTKTVRNRAKQNRWLTKYAQDQIRETGCYVGTTAVASFRHERAVTGEWKKINWIEEFIALGIMKEEEVSIDYKYPNRPIQIILTPSYKPMHADIEAARAAAARKKRLATGKSLKEHIASITTGVQTLNDSSESQPRNERLHKRLKSLLRGENPDEI